MPVVLARLVPTIDFATVGVTIASATAFEAERLLAAPPGSEALPVRSVETPLYGDCGLVTTPGSVVYVTLAESFNV